MKCSNGSQYAHTLIHHHCGESMRVCARSLSVVGPRDTLRTQGRAQAVHRRFVVAVFLVVAVPCCPAVHSQSVTVGGKGARKWGCTSRMRGRKWGSAAGSFVIFLFPSKSRRRDIAL